MPNELKNKQTKPVLSAVTLFPHVFAVRFNNLDEEKWHHTCSTGGMCGILLGAAGIYLIKHYLCESDALRGSAWYVGYSTTFCASVVGTRSTYVYLLSTISTKVCAAATIVGPSFQGESNYLGSSFFLHHHYCSLLLTSIRVYFCLQTRRNHPRYFDPYAHTIYYYCYYYRCCHIFFATMKDCPSDVQDLNSSARFID